MKRFLLVFMAMLLLLISGQTTALAGDHEIYYSYALRDGVKVYEKKDENSKVVKVLNYMEPVEHLKYGEITKDWIEVKLLEDKKQKGYIKIEDASIYNDIAVYYPVKVYLDMAFERPIGELLPGLPVVIVNSEGNEQGEDIWIVANKDVIGFVKPMKRYVDYDELSEIRKYASDKPRYVTNTETKVKFIDSESAPYVATLSEGTKVVQPYLHRKEVSMICFTYGEIPMFGYVVAENLSKIK